MRSDRATANCGAQSRLPSIVVVPGRSTIAEFVVSGSPGPSLLRALRVGDGVRRAVMARTERVCLGEPVACQSDESRTLAALAGHGSGSNDGHAAYFSHDSDGDGLIDRVPIHLAVGFDEIAIRGLDALRRLWLGRDGGWSLRRERMGSAADSAGHPLFGVGREWVSVTPWLHPWFWKNGFGRTEQLERECAMRGWGKPLIEKLGTIMVGDRRERAEAFELTRTMPDARQPDTHGSLWRLMFPAPVRGPIAVGWGKFWWLGLLRFEDHLGHREGSGETQHKVVEQ